MILKRRKREAEEKRVPKGFGSACHVPPAKSRETRGAVDLRGASAHKDRDGGWLLRMLSHISAPNDFFSSAHADTECLIILSVSADLSWNRDVLRVHLKRALGASR